MKDCIDCSHWKIGTEPYQGHCALYSLTCSGSTSKPRFLSKDDARPIKERKPIKGSKAKKVNAFIDTDKAQQIRKRQVVVYPDGMELTDKFKRIRRPSKW